MADRKKLAVLVSGRGTNMQALIDACATPDYPAEIVVVLSNEPEAAGLDRAATSGIEALVVPHRDFDGRESFEAAVTAALEERGVELIVLAGFMRLLTESFVEHWRDRLINIHPSLLPAFKGLDTHERALAAGVRFAGCTVHFVRTEMDSGPIIVQAAVPIGPDDDAASLAARMLEQEHVIYPLAVRLIAEGRVRIENELVTVDGAPAPQGATINPAAPARPPLARNPPPVYQRGPDQTASRRRKPMAKDMEFLQSPEENLGTWDTLMKLIWISAGSIAILLLLLAWAFV